MEKLEFTTLFLDRDGVINQRTPGDYVKTRQAFAFEKGAREALEILAKKFPRIVVVTNQAGIGKGLMTETQLIDIHEFMKFEIAQSGGRVDAVYFCPHRSEWACGCRKPAPGMAFQAKRDFPEIEFSKSIMVGDSASDMVFAKALGMASVLLPGKFEDAEALEKIEVDFRFGSLFDFAANVKFFLQRK